MKKVLLLDNYDSFTYNLAQLLDESNLCEYKIVKNDAVNLNEISEFDKILISPGPGLPKNAGKLSEIIKKYYKNKSIFGICLGMQGIAEFFDAELFNLEKVYHGKEINIQIIDKSEVIFKNLPEQIKVGLYHSWAVYRDLKNTDLKVTAISQQKIIMGISHNKYDVKGIQFHPESIMTEYGKKIIENWLSY